MTLDDLEWPKRHSCTIAHRKDFNEDRLIL